MTEYEKLYRESEEFKLYVDRYAKSNKITAETAMTHKLVKNVADQIAHKEKRYAVLGV